MAMAGAAAMVETGAAEPAYVMVLAQGLALALAQALAMKQVHVLAQAQALVTGQASAAAVNAGAVAKSTTAIYKNWRLCNRQFLFSTPCIFSFTISS
jgi:hypothetical protein